MKLNNLYIGLRKLVNFANIEDRYLSTPQKIEARNNRSEFKNRLDRVAVNKFIYNKEPSNLVSSKLNSYIPKEFNKKELSKNLYRTIESSDNLSRNKVKIGNASLAASSRKLKEEWNNLNKMNKNPWKK